MSEADELKEAAERARESKQLAPVSLTMAILAVFVATVSLMRFVMTPHFMPPSRANEIAVPSCAL